MSSRPSSVELADTASDLLSGVAGWLLIGLGIAAVLSGLGGAIQTVGTAEMAVPIVVLLLGLLSTIFGVIVNPRFRRRHNVSRFGRVQTVESRILSASENKTESCVSCGIDMNKGLVRQYRQEYALAGIPVQTLSENENFYCPTCATEEVPSLRRTNSEDCSNRKEKLTELE